MSIPMRYEIFKNIWNNAKNMNAVAKFYPQHSRFTLSMKASRLRSKGVALKRFKERTITNGCETCGRGF